MTPPKVVVLDISCEDYEKIISLVDDLKYAKSRYGNDTDYAIYTLVEK